MRSDPSSLAASPPVPLGGAAVPLAARRSLWPRERHRGHDSGVGCPFCQLFWTFTHVAEEPVAWPKTPTETRPLRPLWRQSTAVAARMAPGQVRVLPGNAVRQRLNPKTIKLAPGDLCQGAW